jgi:rRNA maturation endonuclease Nob1
VKRIKGIEKNREKKEIVIFDTSSLIHGQLPYLTQFGELWTVPEVINEIKDYETLFKLASLEYFVDKPSENSFKFVKKLCEKFGENLSKTDLKILALAETLKRRFEDKDVDLKIKIATDDYGMQNLAKELDLEIIPIAYEGIKEKRKYWKKCLRCLLVYESTLTQCPRCGCEEFKRVLNRKKGKKRKI